MHALQAGDRLPDEADCFDLLEPLARIHLHLAEEILTLGVLEDQVNLFVVPEVAIEPTDVGVPQSGLNLDLSSEHPRRPVLNQLALEKNLESDDELALFLAGEVHMTELATTQRLPDLKVVDGPGARIERLCRLWARDHFVKPVLRVVT